MRNIYLVFTIFYFSVVSSQKDTLTYNDINVSSSEDNYYFKYKNKNYNGYLKINLEDETTCLEYIKNGKIITNNCNLLKDKRIEQYKLELSNFSIKQAVENHQLNFVVTKVKYSKCKECDTMSFFVKKCSFNNKNYSGYSTGIDTVYFYHKGELKFIKTLYSNSKNTNEYIEYNNDSKNGLYKKYDENKNLTIEGENISNKKSNKWTLYNFNGFDRIVESYYSNKRSRIWYYYVKDNIEKCEFYKNDGQLDYHYQSEFIKNKEIRKYYRNNKNYAISIYINGHIDSYEKVD